MEINIGQDGSGNTKNNTFNVNFPRKWKSDPIPSDVPHGSPHFVGRKQDLEDLHGYLQQEGDSNIVAVCAVRGMGGIGKTELAIQYALSREFQQNYTASYWFSLKEGNLATLILRKTSPYLAMPEELRKTGSIEEQVKWCWQNWHPRDGQILIIIDDVQSLEDIPPEWRPLDSRFRVMITTRERNLSSRFLELPLKVLSENESIELLKKIVDKDGSDRIEIELETAKKICHFLGYLPLGFELAATYLADDVFLTLGEYLQRLNLQDESLSDAMVRGITAERGVIAAFNLSWEKLRGLSSRLAMLLSRFGSADIPWLELVEPTVTALDWDKVAVTEGRKQLEKLHLIDIIGRRIGIHTLLREYFRYQSEREGADFIHQLQRAIAVTCIAIAKTIPFTPTRDIIERVSPSIPHLEHLGDEMLDDIPNPEEDLIEAFVGVAWFYLGQGEYKSAENPLSNCLKEVRSRLGENHRHVATSFNNLAALYKSQGRYSEAEHLFTRSLAILERQLGENHPDVAHSLNNLAALYKSQGRYSEAETRFTRSLAILEQVLGKNHLEVVQSLNNLAGLYKSQGRYSEAEPLYKRSLAIREQQLGENHPHVATGLNNLAALYKSQGRYSEAEPLFTRSLAILERQLGENHPNVAASLNNLAVLYEAQGKLEEAERLARRALTIYQTALGKDHSYTLNSLLMVKGLQMRNRLDCDESTLFGILQAIARANNIPNLNTGILLSLLELIENDPALIEQLRQYYRQ